MSAEQLELLLQQARQMARQRNFPAAIELYRQLGAAAPDSVAVHEGLATAAFVSGDLDLAVQEFQRLTQLEPLQARHHVNLGAVLNRAGNYQKATDALRKAIQRDRKSAEAYYNLGIAHRKLNQLSLAVSAYKEAIRINPAMAEAYQNLGNVYSEMKNYPLAISHFQKALEIDPNFERARVGLERAEDAARNAKAAINPFGRLVAAPNSTTGHVTGDQRELTDSERLFDRQMVCRLADEISTLISDSNRFLRSELAPAILELERSVAEGNFSGLGYNRAAHHFFDAIDSWRQLQTRTRAKLRELRSHDDRMTSPEGLKSA